MPPSGPAAAPPTAAPARPASPAQREKLAIVDLTFAIEINGVRHASLTLGRPTAADWAWYRRQSGNDRQKAAAMLARLCDLTLTDFEDLDWTDLDRLNETYQTKIEGV